MVEAFRGLGVEAVPGVGAPFDPELHEAIMREEADDVPDGTVLREFRRGFRLGDKLLRAGMVQARYSPRCVAALSMPPACWRPIICSYIMMCDRMPGRQSKRAARCMRACSQAVARCWKCRCVLWSLQECCGYSGMNTLCRAFISACSPGCECLQDAHRVSQRARVSGVVHGEASRLQQRHGRWHSRGGAEHRHRC